jgi:DNA-binding HxlR family transcriptional regulator
MKKVTNADYQAYTRNKNSDTQGNNSNTPIPQYPTCPVMTTLAVIGGKWKPAILWEIDQHGVRRFGELKKAIRGITQKMLTQQLRELEEDNILVRKVYAQVPPKVEYDFSPYGETLWPILHEMAAWGLHHRTLADKVK